jgi:prepilin-type N-terminal cleavage/methylation domain-containing protein
MKYSKNKIIQGFTLIEVLVTLAIFVVVMVAVGYFEVNIYTNQSAVSGSFGALQNSQAILKFPFIQIQIMMEKMKKLPIH